MPTVANLRTATGERTAGGPPVAAHSSAEARLAAALARAARLVRALRKSCRARPTASRVHRLRVASRRLLAGLDLGAHVLDGRRRKQARLALKALLRALGPLRDAAVMREQLSRCRPRPAARSALLRLLAAREQRARRAIPRRLRRCPLRRALAFLATAAPSAAATPAGEARLRTAFALALLRSRARLLARWPQSVDDFRAFHRTRIAAKRLRYQLEAVANLGLASTARSASQLQRLQRLLGQLHDGELLLAHLRRPAFQRHLPGRFGAALLPSLERRCARLRLASLRFPLETRAHLPCLEPIAPPSGS